MDITPIKLISENILHKIIHHVTLVSIPFFGATEDHSKITNYRSRM